MKELIGREIKINDKEGEITNVLGTTHLEITFFNLNDGKTSVDIRDINKYLIN